MLPGKIEQYNPDPEASLKGDTLLALAAKYKLKYFVETGTYFGEMVKYVRDHGHFKNIVSIELHEILWMNAYKMFEQDPHVQILQGNSSDVLSRLKFPKPTLFWLDAHYSGGFTAMGSKVTPVKDELGVILSKDVNHVYVIDDMNYMPNWGVSPGKLEEYILSVRPDYKVSIIGKLMIAEPNIK
jgi:hypothetical protein